MNYKSLAKKGRYGDTEIRNVAGKRSHVNKREANLIDVLGRKGEALTQALGAGTRNPKTGMPEYHVQKYSWGGPKINAHNADHAIKKLNPINAVTSGVDATVDFITGGYVDLDSENLFTQDYNPTVGDTQIRELAGYSTYIDNEGEGPDDDGYTSPDSSSWQNSEGDISDIIKNIMLEGGYDKKYDFNDDGVVDAKDIVDGIREGGFDEDDYTEFDYTDDNLTSGEFRSAVNDGNFDLLTGDYGIEKFEGILDDTEELGFLDEQKELTGDILTTNLESAETSYKTSIEGAQKDIGRSLFDINTAVSGQESKGGFAGSGFIASTGKRAKRGVFQDYKMQQKQLGEGLASARSSFDSGMDQRNLTYRRGVESFWDNMESQYYDRLGYLDDNS